MQFNQVARILVFTTMACVVVIQASHRLHAQNTKQIPGPLRPWQEWVTWDEEQRQCPTVYYRADERICFWPAKLSLVATDEGASWNVSVTVFSKAWVPLPGSDQAWPLDVMDNDAAISVVQRDDGPAVQLGPGKHALSGKFQWDQMPQRIAVPPQVGILALSVQGEAVAIPTWDADGHVWLKRDRITQTEQDQLTVQLYRVVEDDIPTWLETEIQLTVTGKSREEELGWSLPAGFQLATVDSPLPVAVDDLGRMKAQVRAGKWAIRTRAFRLANSSQIRFSETAEPITNSELIGFRAQPEFRLAEIEGLATVDVSQTTFPQPWRDLPVYQWETSTGFQLIEKVRGMGLQAPRGLQISRQFWLDEDGRSLTFQDQIAGRMQQTWRLDVADRQHLGTVRVDGEPQLITANPATGSHGVEIRTRDLRLDAIGRIDGTDQLPATGWQTDAEQLGVTMILPPGWRAFALFGADHVEGDWLTAWWMLDLFLLLIFSLGVYRIFGVHAGLVAFLAFGLAYHEPGSPRLTWLFLLIPVALLKVVPDGLAKQWIMAWKYLAVALLVINLVPFAARQIQTAIYPQLETPGVQYAPRGMFWALGSVYSRSTRVADVMYESREMAIEAAQLETAARSDSRSKFESSNLLYDPTARIQTGPAQPQWRWNLVHASWDGPVTENQTIQPWLIPMSAHRILNVVRVLLLALLGALLIRMRGIRIPGKKAAAVAGTLFLVCGISDSSWADEIPNQPMLELLRERILKAADVYPHAADIPTAELSLEGNRLTLTAEVHAAIDVAVPMPGRLSELSPATVTIDGQTTELVCRKDGYLWIVLNQGVHTVQVVSRLPDVADWEWTYLLKPRHVSIRAPSWDITGVGPNGVPEGQVFFSRQIATAGVAAYDRKDFNAVVLVDRHLEIGLLWQVRTEVTRLAATGKAVSLKVPLLPGENVLTANVTGENGFVDVRLGAEQEAFSWNSELPVGTEIDLATRPDDDWIERWHLLASPVWNKTQTGLMPSFEPGETGMIPVWHPWPGEQVTLSFHKPEPVSGPSMTVQQVTHSMSLGSRQRLSSLRLDVECSVGGDFRLDMASIAEVTSLMLDGQAIPIRRSDSAVLLSLRPGKQVVEAEWKTNQIVKTNVDTGQVSLPVQAANTTTTMHVPETRWVLWADGPLRGPAVRFWTILATALLIAWLLGSHPRSPLSRLEWMLLAIGLTQVHVAAGLMVVAWLFLLAYRGRQERTGKRVWLFNLGQIGIVALTFIVLGVFVVVVRAGLLGSPEMFIVGNGSTRTTLHWFQPRTGTELPVGRIVSVSVWFYQLLMLLWALWLAASLLRWLKWGWTQFAKNGVWRTRSKIAVGPPIAG